MARITVVDDRPEFLDVIREILEQNGHEPTCIDGLEADLASLAATRPDLLIVDLRLGDPALDGPSGWEIVELVRADLELRSVPIIVCSADRQAIDAHRPELRAMADVHVLPKPFSVVDAEAMVAAALRPAAAAARAGMNFRSRTVGRGLPG